MMPGRIDRIDSSIEVFFSCVVGKEGRGEGEGGEEREGGRREREGRREGGEES